MARYYIDYMLRCDLMKEDKTDNTYPIVDSHDYLHSVVADIYSEDVAKKLVSFLNQEDGV